MTVTQNSHGSRTRPSHIRADEPTSPLIDGGSADPAATPVGPGDPGDHEPGSPTTERQAAGHRLPGWADARSIGLLVVVLTVLAGYWWWDGRAQPQTAAAEAGGEPPLSVTGASPPADKGPSRSMSEAPTPAGPEVTDPRTASDARNPALPAGPGSVTVTVDVRGGVRDRGVHVLPEGSRVMDAIEAAGGLRPGKSYGPLNLAEILSDGQQVIVGRGARADPDVAGPSRPDPPGGSVGSTRAPAPTSINLNDASATELQGLPGVGPVLAERIVAWRDQNGRFDTVNDLLKVSGIGDKVLSGLADLATVQ